MENIWNDYLYTVPNVDGAMDVIDGLRAFVATAETSSFTGAAERLGISNRLTSKYVAELEQRLGVRLLQRTTRKVGITAAGEELLARAPALLDELDEMLAAVTEGTRGFSGTVRISAPVTFGEIYVKDLLSQFAAPHPDLTIDLRLNDAFVDLAKEGIDLAFRIGEPTISALKRSKLGTIKTAVVASPDYLARFPLPQVPDDLRRHRCIVDTNRADAPQWVLKKNGETYTIAVPTRYLVNSAQVARDLAVAGHGIAYCPTFVLGTDLEEGRLIRLFPDHESTTHIVSVVYLAGRTLPRKVRALIDFAQQDIRRSGLA